MSQYKYKQVICVRIDLNMRKGKMAAQTAHASLNAYLTAPDLDRSEWLSEGGAKIVVGVVDEQALLQVLAEATDAKLPVALVTDHGHTEFHGVWTKTACAIGPAPIDLIDVITGPNGRVKTKLL